MAATAADIDKINTTLISIMKRLDGIDQQIVDQGKKIDSMSGSDELLPQPKTEPKVAVKVGPWGASTGQQHHDIRDGSMPQSLVSITICCSKPIHGGGILGFSFVYVDQHGEPIEADPWGIFDPEQPPDIVMRDGEYLYGLSGNASDTTLLWLKLVTNQREVVVGRSVHLAPTFSVPLGNRKVVAFFGRSDSINTITELGIYVPLMRDSPVKVGPWVGEPVNINTPVQLKSVTVHSTQGRICGFSFTYIDVTGQTIIIGPWGRINGQRNTFDLGPGEYVNDNTGTFDDGGVTSLKFTTNQGVVYGPYGNEAGTAFNVPLPIEKDENGAVVGFFGRSGQDSLVALGVYVGLAPKP